MWNLELKRWNSEVWRSEILKFGIFEIENVEIWVFFEIKNVEFWFFGLKMQKISIHNI